jgi:hypothetical protein
MAIEKTQNFFEFCVVFVFKKKKIPWRGRGVWWPPACYLGIKII